MLTSLFSFAAVVATTVASPVAFSLPPPSPLHIHQTRATAPGAIACNNLTASLGASKVQQPISLEYQASKFEYWNAKQSNYAPTCAVYPTSAQDVSTAIKAIRAAKSRFAIKAQGHNPNTFFSSVDQGVLIDLNQMTQRTYDASSTIGTYQPGGTFGDVYNYFQQYGRTVVGARLAGVGTGLALGGGLSYLSPQYGLACDSFRELEVVLPSGQIVTASSTQNSDLFFADRGGGGNAYGVVTKYTIQTRPSGTFYAGNIIYLFNQSAVLEAIANFIKYNTDPKASIIGTYEKLLTPAVGDLDLDQAIIMFLVYDGPDAGNAFANFTKIPNLFNSLGKKTYPEVVNMPIPLSTELSRGDNIFRVAVHRINDNTYQQHFDAWSKWCESNKGQYILSSLDFQPIPKSLTDASKSQNGGNAMQMPDGPWFWLNFLISTPPTLTTAQYNSVQASFRDMVNSVPSASGLPLFINDANADQNPLKTFSTYAKLQQIKKKYDPDNFFAQYTGGWNFNA
ncbi:putative FAD-linked oxidoreductase [Pseudocercospora fuligena]|uniref:Putative FAD-linked oxidoreductase n=1 Tax=Pseudocercospora fuligena TaxID=685502 RepID=A0A8H6VEM0_9PEZI|nr:putative FAD-linked oxidoreductase [Pseudocercospora fuligena]